MSKEVTVSVRDVVKDFSLRHTHTLKERLVWTLTGRRSEMIDNFRALDHVSFDITAGETVALLGLNGSGKSTMLKLTSGVMRPSTGFVGYKGRIAGLIEVGAGFHPDLTGRENVYLNGTILGMTKAQIDAAFDDIVAFSEIEQFIDTEVKFYSSGMFLRLAFSVCVYTNPDVFLIDEILAVGDEPFRKKCYERIRELQNEGKTMIIVSHDLDTMRDFCARGLVLERGRLVKDGPIDECIAYLREERE